MPVSIELLIRELEGIISKLHRKGDIQGDDKLKILNLTTQLRILYKREQGVKKNGN